MHKIAISFLICLIATSLFSWILSHPIAVFASDDFTTTFNTTYTVTDDGITQVNQEINLQNNKADTYATQYSLTLGSTRIKDIVPLSSNGNHIRHTVDESDNYTTINLDFDEQVVGKGQTHTFNVQYTDLDMAQRVGNVMEINVPKLDATDQVDFYNVTLLVPKEYGQPSIVSPKIFQLETDPVFTKLTFTNNAAVNKGITAIFGSKQIFEFNLTYHLQNDTVTPIETQIALPPDTPYQQIFFDQIDPSPLSTFKDTDGNWIASYALEPKQIQAVTVDGFAIVFIDPTIPVTVSDTNLNNYLQEQPYWPVKDNLVTDISASLTTPEQIYNYLVETFNYDYSRIDNQSTLRLGAKMALQEPESSLCLEFADSYVTLARSAGIPARLLTGFAYTKNSQLRPLSLVQDILHAWPEYYNFDTKRWHPVDPTWGNTTGGIDYFNQLGFNHLVFAIQGSSSDRPFPAGYYTLEGSESKNVQVNYSTIIPEEKVHFETNLHLPFLSKLRLTDQATLNIKNLSNRAFYNLPVEIAGMNLEINPSTSQVDEIIPYATVKIPVEFDTDSPITSQYQVNSSIYGQKHNHLIQIYSTETILTLIVIATSFTIFIIIGGFAFKSRGILVPGRPKKDSLRRQGQKSEK